MTRQLFRSLLGQVRQRVGGPPDADTALLERFVATRDEAAFAELLRRYGPFVLGVCRQVLGNGPDAEDAFQSVFIILARKAASIRQYTSLSGWLHRVAVNVACTARTATARRHRHERRAASMAEPVPTEPTTQSCQPVIHEEVDRLPEKFRVPIVLCYLHGKSHEEAAEKLGWPVGTVKSRLGRARDMLRGRLTRRGLAPAVALALLEGGVVAAAVPPTLERAAFEAAVSTVAVTTPATALAKATLASMNLAKLRAGVLLAVALLLMGAGTGWLCWQSVAGQEASTYQPPSGSAGEGPRENGRVDLHGDPLPHGAVLRLGTVRLRLPSSVFEACFSADGKLLATGDEQGVVRIWDVASGKQAHACRDHQDAVSVLAFSGNGQFLASTGGDGRVRLWEPTTGKLLRTLPEQRSPVRAITFVQDGQALIAVTEAADLLRWDPSTGELLKKFAGDGTMVGKTTWSSDKGRAWQETPNGVGAVAFSPDGRTVAFGEASGSSAAKAIEQAEPTEKLQIVLRDLTSGKIVRRWPAHQNEAFKLAFALDGKLLVSGTHATNDKSLCFWDPATGTAVTGFPEIDCFYGSFAVTPDGQSLIATNWQEDTVVCNLQNKKAKPCNLPPGGDVLAISPNGKRLAVLNDSSRAVHVYSLPSGEEYLPLGHRAPVGRVAFSPDGRHLATVSEGTFGNGYVPTEEWTLRLWDASSGREVGRVKESGERIQFLAFSVDGARVVSAGMAGPWDPATGKRGPARHEENGRTAMAYSADQKLLALVLSNGNLELRDAVSGKSIASARLPLPERLAQRGLLDSCMSIAISPDGSTVAVGINDGTLTHAFCLWDLAADRVRGPFAGHWFWLTSVAFSPDGKTLATTGGDGHIRLWEVSTGQPRAVIGLVPEALHHWMERLNTKLGGGHWSPHCIRDVFRATSFAPDGKMLASAGIDGVVRIWDVATGKLLASYTGHSATVLWVAFSPDGRRLASASEDTTVLIWDISAVKPVKPSTAALAPGVGEALWAALADNDAQAAYQAMRSLRRLPAPAVALFAEHLRPVAAPDARRLEQLLAELEKAEFATRLRATEELEKAGDAAVPLLRRALDAKPALEVQQRLEQLLKKAAQAPMSKETLRALRAVEVLEQIDTPEARRLLERLAKGAQGARLTAEARTALRRSAR